MDSNQCVIVLCAAADWGDDARRFKSKIQNPKSKIPMSLATLPLSYCSNVHPAQSVTEVIAGIDAYSGPMRERCGFPVAAGLWLAAPVIRELQDDATTVASLQAALSRNDLICYTLNAFRSELHGEVQEPATPEGRQRRPKSARARPQRWAPGSSDRRPG